MGEILTARSAPYDAEIEYLESTGIQWIDAGVVWNPTQTRIVGKIHYSKEASAYNAAPQSRDTVGSTMYYYGFNLKNSSLNPVARLQVANVFVDNQSFVTQLNTQYIFSVECNNNNIVALVDNQTICTLTNASSLRVSTNTLYLYARNQGNGDVGVYANGLCYHFLQIYSGDTLVRDFIPVRVGQIGYMYDRVSQTLFGNKGTGNFILGKDIHWTKTLNTRIKNRYDTEENWLTENPILLSGEPAFTTVSGEQKSKVGDGETPYANLPYINDMDEAMIIRKWRD